MLQFTRFPRFQVTSNTRINIDSAHIVPAVGLWQLWKIIISGCVAGVTGFGVVFVLVGTFIVLSQTSFFNKKIQTQNAHYDNCISLRNLTYSSAEENQQNIKHCYARAKLLSSIGTAP